MLKKIRNSNRQKAPKPLPKGFKLAVPSKSRKLRRELAEPDITVSGGTHTLSDGQPLLRRHTVPK
jgi:hypothetical protein